MKRDYVYALIDIFERTGLLEHFTSAQFFTATDEQKLNIAERESANESFQILLITYVELRIDFENLLWYLQQLAGKPAYNVDTDHGLQLCHSERFTWEESTDKIKEEERLKETLEAARQRAKDSIEKEPGLLKTRVEKAIEILSAADRMATKYDCDIRVHEQVLRDYAVLLEEHMAAFPDLTGEAPEVAGRLLSMLQTIFSIAACFLLISSSSF